jgi:hypothetical protein
MFFPATNEFNIRLSAEPDTVAETIKIITETTETVRKETDWKQVAFQLMLLIAFLFFILKK